jgi:DNA transformation protein
MATSQLTIDYYLDKLSLVEELSYKRMFGGVGFFSNKKMFGMLSSTEEFRLKVDDSNRTRYEEKGMEPLTMTSKRGTGTMPYYQVPEEVVSDPEVLKEWADLSIVVAMKKK